MTTRQQEFANIQAGINRAKALALKIQSELSANAAEANAKKSAPAYHAPANTYTAPTYSAPASSYSPPVVQHTAPVYSAPQQSTDTNGVAQSGVNDKFLQALQARMMGMSAIQSSANTQIEDRINQAVAGLKQSQVDTHTATNLAYGRQEAAVTLTGQNKLTQAEEAQRGYAVNTGLIKNITNTTNTEMKDLELRKQEALAYGDAQMAGKIANLQMEGLQFQQKAQQQVFTNLLSMGGLIMKGQQQDRVAQAQTFQEHQAISNIALRYGIQVQPNDTIDSITAKASQFATKSQQLELQKTQAQINEINAQTSRALRTATTEAPLTDAEASVIATAARHGGGASLGLIKNADNYAKVVNYMVKQQYTDYKQTATVNRANGMSKSDAVNAIQTNPGLSISQKADAIKAIDEVYALPNKSTLPKWLQPLPPTVNDLFSGMGTPSNQSTVPSNGNSLFTTPTTYNNQSANGGSFNGFGTNSNATTLNYGGFGSFTNYGK